MSCLEHIEITSEVIVNEIIIEQSNNQTIVDVTQVLNPYEIEIESKNVLNIAISAYEQWLLDGNIGTEQDFLDSLVGKSAYQTALDNGFVGTEQQWLDSLRTGYNDLELSVVQDDQIQFNIFSQPIKSNLFINDLVYFETKSYLIQEINNSWRLIWLDEFNLKIGDHIIFRKIN
jgi:hypothetical protein